MTIGGFVLTLEEARDAFFASSARLALVLSDFGNPNRRLAAMRVWQESWAAYGRASAEAVLDGIEESMLPHEVTLGRATMQNNEERSWSRR